MHVCSWNSSKMNYSKKNSQNKKSASGCNFHAANCGWNHCHLVYWNIECSVWLTLLSIRKLFSDRCPTHKFIIAITTAFHLCMHSDWHHSSSRFFSFLLLLSFSQPCVFVCECVYVLHDACNNTNCVCWKWITAKMHLVLFLLHSIHYTIITHTYRIKLVSSFYTEQFFIVL